MPRAAHRLVDQSVGGIVADEELFVGVEMQRAVQTPGLSRGQLRIALPCRVAQPAIRLLPY